MQLHKPHNALSCTIRNQCNVAFSCLFIYLVQNRDIRGIQLKNVCKINFQADDHNSVVWNGDYVHPLVQTHASHVVSAQQKKIAPFLTTNILEFYQWQIK